MECVAGCVSTDSVIVQDSEEMEDEDDAAAATAEKQPTCSVQGSQGQRVAKAVTNLEKKKQQRTTRQEQVLRFT